MKRIKKVLFFNVVAICTCVCLFVGTIADAAPYLRPHSLFDKVNESQNKGRICELLFKIQILIHKSLTAAKAPHISHREKKTFLSSWSYVKNLIVSVIFLGFTAYRLYYDLLLKEEVRSIVTVMPKLTYAEILKKCTTPYYGAPLPFGLYKLINGSSLLLHINHWWLNDFIYFPSLAAFGYAMLTSSYIVTTSSMNRIKFVRGRTSNIKTKTDYLQYLFFITTLLSIATIKHVVDSLRIDNMIVFSLSIFFTFLVLPILVFPVKDKLESNLSLEDVKSEPELSSKNSFFTKPKLSGVLEKTLKTFIGLRSKLSQI